MLRTRVLLLLLLLAAVAGCRPLRPTTSTAESVPCWGGQELGTFGRTQFFCEKVRARCAGQPANTWSALAYLLAAGLGVRWFRKEAPRAAGRADRAFGSLLAAECCYLGLGSGFYHASLTRWAERWDMSATYGVVLALLGYAGVRLLAPERRFVVALSVAGVLAVQALVTAFKFHMEDFILLPIVILCLVLELGLLLRRGRAARRSLKAGVGAALMGGVVWGLDVTHLACAPESPFQGHALWHVLTAVSIACTWRALRGGRP